nr:uncharacterized protein LOC121502588 [Drosophila kikkawai]
MVSRWGIAPTFTPHATQCGRSPQTNPVRGAIDVPPDHRFGPIRVDTTPPRPRPAEAAHTPADQGKQPLTDQGPPPLVPLRTTRAPSTQATQEGSHRHGQRHRQPARRRVRTPARCPHDAYRQPGAATTGSTSSNRSIDAPAHRSGHYNVYRPPPGTRAVQAVAAPDPDGEVEAALRECLGDLPPDVLEEMAHGAEGLDLEDLFGESPDEDGVELPMRPVSNQSADEPRTPSPQFQPDYEEISSDEGVEAEIIQISTPTTPSQGSANHSEPRSARDDHPHQHRHAEAADGVRPGPIATSESSSGTPRSPRSPLATVLDGWSTPNGTLPAGLISRIQQPTDEGPDATWRRNRVSDSGCS